MKQILLTGGSGTLGSEILKIDNKILAPSSKELNILNNNYKASNFDILIHCAALTNTVEAESNPQKANLINIFGTINMLNLAIKNNAKFVYISTDYVFDGQKGYYSVSDKINPISNYAKTKASAELLARTYEKSVILRTSFCKSKFPYDKAFDDQWTSRDYVDVIAPLIYEASMENDYGVYHIGTERKSVYELALRRKFVLPIKRSDVCGVKIPKDTSFLF